MSITTPPLPHLPRQTPNPKDPYGLSSLMAQLSSQYPYLYSSYSYNPGALSSILKDLSSYYPSYTYPGAGYSYSISIPRFSTAIQTTGTVRATGTRQTSNPTLTAAESQNSGSSSGLSTGAKIGIGVAVPLILALFVGIGICFFCCGKRRGRKGKGTIVAPIVTPNMGAGGALPPMQHMPQQQQQQQYYTAPPPPQQQQQNMNAQGYMQGYTQQLPPPQQQQYQHVLPPQYTQAQAGLAGPGVDTSYAGAQAGGYDKGPRPGVVEMETEYHFAKPGVVEMGDGTPVEYKGK
ncbi:hypothetical protein B0J11DRAFT_579212 [Dendryphion nanum]|uniref:Uncharacterized protein n=1 Tax=Dendryphion nanum TaxID=256645 RepID=A0A9P9DYG1_9PLEO|nr:hypothetical protein B0J11DRAFT_579212 [Dendryphion nanum]